MNGRWLGERSTRRLLGAVVLAVLAASCWWGWMAWDRSYRVDPATGETSGPYEAWQVVGCVLCLVMVCVVATKHLPVWVVVPVTTAAFTGAWSWTASGVDSSGLWLVGAVLVLIGTAIGAALVSGVTAMVRCGRSRQAGTPQRSL